MRRASISCGHLRIGAEQMPLRSGPQTEEHFSAATFLKEIAIAITRKQSRAATQTEQLCIIVVIGVRNLKRADICLFIAKALMLGGVFSSQRDGHTSRGRDVDHCLIHALGMHVDLDRPAGACDSFEERLPEGIAALRDAALAMNAHGESLNLRTLLQNDCQCIAAVSGVRFRRKTIDMVIGIRASRPFVGMRPDAQLKMQAALAGLGGDKLQHLEVAIPLVIAERHRLWQHFAVCRPQLHHAYATVSRNLKEVRIRQVQIVVRYAARKVVFEAIGQTETVEPACHESIEISRPKLLVVVPGLVFELAAKITAYATNWIRGPLFDRFGYMQRSQRIRPELRALRQFKQAVDESTLIGPGNENRWRIRHMA